jgi:HPt (histidine-containing phosphotransfer) domain-containing protein
METLDRERLMRNVDGDRELLAEIIDLFFDTSAGILEDIRAAVAKADPDALNRSAHQLKGTLANLGAKAASEAASHLETLGRNRTMTGLEQAFRTLETEMQRLEPELRELARTAGK